MAETFGQGYIQAELEANTDITDIVGTSIYAATLVPKGDSSEKTINYYLVDLFNGGLEYFERRWSIDCRSKNEAESQNIAWLVLETLNREFGLNGGYTYFGVCEILRTLPPVTDVDMYNTSVQFYLRRK